MLIRQSLRGNFRSNDLDITEATWAVIGGMFEGVVERYEQKSVGGTDVPTPAVLRGMRFGVSRPADNLSATVNLKHVKPSKHSTDVFANLGLFDADYNSSLSATKIRQIYQGAKA